VPTPLPPLPPAFAVTTDDVRPGGRSMVDQLTRDHDQIMRLCAELRSAVADNAASTQTVADVLVATVSRHLSAEEQYLYPTVRAALPDGGPLADHELTEDAAMLQSLKSLSQTTIDHPALPGLVETVTRQLNQHARRAVDDLFPGLREHCSDNELVRLGNRVEIAAEAAPTRPHPGTPLTPPVNKVVDPALGVVDKVRDLLSRRTTRPEDL
jgi:hypothetical protein